MVDSLGTFGITAVILEEFPIGNEAVAILSDEKLIPIFDFSSTFSSDDDFGIWLVDAETFPPVVLGFNEPLQVENFA